MTLYKDASRAERVRDALWSDMARRLPVNRKLASEAIWRRRQR